MEEMGSDEKLFSGSLAAQTIRRATSALQRPAVRRVVISLLLAVFLIGGSIVSLETGLTSDESDEQKIFQINVAAVKSLYLGQPGKFQALQASDNKYYGIGFHVVAYPVQVLLQSPLKRILHLDSETALLFGKHPVVFNVFVVSVVVFYRLARFFIRERSVAFAIGSTSLSMREGGSWSATRVTYSNNGATATSHYGRSWR